MKFKKYYLCGYKSSKPRFVIGIEEGTGMLFEKDRYNKWVYTNLSWRMFNKKLTLVELYEDEVEMMSMNI